MTRNDKLMDVRGYFSLSGFSKHLLKIVRKIREGDDSVRSGCRIAIVILRICGRLLARCAKEFFICYKYFLHGIFNILMLPNWKNKSSRQSSNQRSYQSIHQPFTDQIFELHGIEKVKSDDKINGQKDYESQVVNSKETIGQQHEGDQ